MSSDSFEMVGVSLQSYSPPPASSASFQESRLWFRLSCHVRPCRAGAARLLHLSHAGTKQQQWHPRDTVLPSPPCRHCQSSPGLAGKTRSSFADNDAYALAIMMGLIETTTTRLDMHDLVRPPTPSPTPTPTADAAAAASTCCLLASGLQANTRQASPVPSLASPRVVFHFANCK